MADLGNCPLDPNTILQLALPMGLSHLEAIENHVSADNCPHPPLKEFVFHGHNVHLKETTPLLLACHYGELESVKRIVESWGADINAAAPYYPRPSLTPIEFLVKLDVRATPLFAAAFQGHSRVVRYLLEKGADVTAKTSSKFKREFNGLTPLYGALSHHFMFPRRNDPLEKQQKERNAIVISLLEFGADLSATYKPSWMMGRLCGVDATVTIINHGVDLKQHERFSGETVLHHWASLPYNFTEEDSLTIVKLLIKKGADVMARNIYGFTPIIIAAQTLGYRLNFAFFYFFLERDDIATMEKIEAMELAGGKILSFPRNAPQFPKAFDYLRRATHLRQTEGSYQKKLAQYSVGTVEWTTLDQLENIIQHSSEHEIQIQLFLLRSRILSSRSWEAVSCYLSLDMSDSYFELMANEEEYRKLLDFQWTMLDTILLFQPSEKGIWCLSVIVVSSIIDTLMNLKSSNPKLLNLEIIKKSIHLILATDQFRLADRKRMTRTETSYSSAMFSFLTMLLGLQEMLDDIRESLLQLFGHLERNQLEYLLLRACKDYESVNYFFTIRLLLQLGANVGAADKDGNGPLHLVAQADSEQSEAAGCLLIGYGAQLFRTNNSGKTAVELWIERNEMKDEQEGDDGAPESRGRPDWCRTVRKLKCLSATCIRVYGVPFKDGPEFFQDSHSFIEKH